MDANSRNCSSNHQHDRTHRTQETPTLATGQAPLHVEGGRETPSARRAARSTPFVVRVGLEAARNYPTRQRESADDRIHRITDAEFFDEQRRAVILAALDEYEHALRALDMHP